VKTLITGAAGYLGRGLVEPFAGRHELRLMDVVGFKTTHDLLVGDVADLETARRATEGMDAMVIAHMASRQAGAYQTPAGCFDANVKGTANLFFAAAERGIRRVVLISSDGVRSGHPKGTFGTGDLPPKGNDLYTLTKACQEVIAEQYARVEGMGVAVFRLGWVMNADTVIDKYGKKIPHYCVGMTDPRDIGQAARLACELPDLGYEVLYVYGTPEADESCDAAHARRRLGWKPKYDFKWLPTAEEYERAKAEGKTP